MSAKMTRKRLLVDNPFQVGLTLKVSFYLLTYSLIVFHIALIYEAMAYLAAGNMVQSIGDFYLAFLDKQKGLLWAFVLVTPIFLYDLLKFSNRIAGPIFRCQKVMEEMAGGKTVPEFKPRSKDFMAQFFQSFNKLIKEWNRRVGSAVNSQVQPKSPANPETSENSSN